MSMKRVLSGAIAIALLGLFALPSQPAQASLDESLCTTPHLYDKGVTRTWIDSLGAKGAGGTADGIDDWAGCDSPNAWDSENIIDLYRSGEIDKWNGSGYVWCVLVTGGWLSYYSTSGYEWSYTNESYLLGSGCGWDTGPIKVHTLGKFEYADSVIQSLWNIRTHPEI